MYQSVLALIGQKISVVSHSLAKIFDTTFSFDNIGVANSSKMETIDQFNGKATKNAQIFPPPITQEKRKAKGENRTPFLFERKRTRKCQSNGLFFITFTNEIWI